MSKEDLASNIGSETLSETSESVQRGPAQIAVECVDVHKRFGDVKILQGFDLRVDRGEFVAITGASGCGKSTLLHLLAALDRPDSGSIRVNDQDLLRLRAPNRYRRSDVGIIFQLHNLMPRLTAAQNVELAMFGTRHSPREREERAMELLTQFKLDHACDRDPTRLSGGERQRVAIARALANEPAILLADEPTGSLDAESADGVLEHLMGLRIRRGLTIIMVTHDEAAQACADRRVTIDNGRVVSPADDAR